MMLHASIANAYILLCLQVNVQGMVLLSLPLLQYVVRMMSTEGLVLDSSMFVIR